MGYRFSYYKIKLDENSLYFNELLNVNYGLVW